MAISFDNTISGSSSNSYSAVADYNQYRVNHGLAERTTEEAQVDLIKATSWLDNQYRDKWKTNSVAVDGQALHWPQSAATDSRGDTLPDDEIPSQVLQAVYEYAITAVNQSSLAPVQQTNVKMQELEGLGKIENFNAQSATGLPDAYKFIDTILYGLITGRSGGLRTIRAERV